MESGRILEQMSEMQRRCSASLLCWSYLKLLFEREHEEKSTLGCIDRIVDQNFLVSLMEEARFSKNSFFAVRILLTIRFLRDLNFTKTSREWELLYRL